MKDETLRARWSLFLGRLVAKEGEGGKVPFSALDDALAARMERKGRARGQIGAYLEEDQSPRPRRVFYIGEALRDCGVAWMSGFLTLGAIGYSTEQWALLEAIDQIDRRKGALMWNASSIERHLWDLPGVHKLLADCWREIGDETMTQAWVATQKARFRPRSSETISKTTNVTRRCSR